YAFLTESREKATPEEKSLARYAELQGWTGVQWVPPTSSLDQMARSMSAGDIALVSNLDALDPRPSKQEQTVMDLFARGVSLHVLSLNGAIDAHILPLRQTWATAKRFEAQYDALVVRMDRREVEMKQEMDAFESEVVAQMAQRFGVKTLMQNLPADP